MVDVRARCGSNGTQPPKPSVPGGVRGSIRSPRSPPAYFGHADRPFRSWRPPLPLALCPNGSGWPRRNGRPEPTEARGRHGPKSRARSRWSRAWEPVPGAGPGALPWGGRRAHPPRRRRREPCRNGYQAPGASCRGAADPRCAPTARAEPALFVGVPDPAQHLPPRGAAIAAADDLSGAQPPAVP